MENVVIDDKAKDFILAKRVSAVTVKLEKFGGG